MIVFLAALLMILGLIGRMVYLMVFDAEYYQKKAEDLHERERKIKAARGEIIDTNGTVLATNRTVCTISVIHSQIKEPEVGDKKTEQNVWASGGSGKLESGWRRCLPWNGLKRMLIRRQGIRYGKWNLPE